MSKNGIGRPSGSVVQTRPPGREHHATSEVSSLYYDLPGLKMLPHEKWRDENCLSEPGEAMRSCNLFRLAELTEMRETLNSIEDSPDGGIVGLFGAPDGNGPKPADT